MNHQKIRPVLKACRSLCRGKGKATIGPHAEKVAARRPHRRTCRGQRGRLGASEARRGRGCDPRPRSRTFLGISARGQPIAGGAAGHLRHASSEISLAIEALKTGAADFVIKTAGPDFDVQLLAALERALELARLRREKERAHDEAREERDRAKALLEEVNHRVANSLALVIALVRMQASATPEVSAKTVLAETEARIAAVANIHRTLYASEDILAVDLDVYLGQLVDELRRAIAVESLTPTLSVHAVAARIATDKAVAIGVITTELITNAIKYAYPAATGEIRLRLEPDAGGGLILSVEDDGVGFAGGRAKGEGLGARIVAAMAHSLGAELEYDNRDKGTRAFMRLSGDLFIEPPGS